MDKVQRIGRFSLDDKRIFPNDFNNNNMRSYCKIHPSANLGIILETISDPQIIWNYNFIFI